jgi:hypothetical protein
MSTEEAQEYFKASPESYWAYAKAARRSSRGGIGPSRSEQVVVKAAGPVERRIEAAVDLMLKEHPEWTREACYGRVLANRELYNEWRREQMLTMAGVGGGDAA